ncbi:hypothetical protein F441_03428 [Phytophthora nicotianae CJ01A1]|uniref:MULE transposase domain-containing protein n=2 Tax=Phytophthora nicotianae TaxID=4792 RepID=W2XL85_PHYNI|nr:hypothetical protein L915_00679 [Phytophthora nicotianae]ETP23441.1 hypothetical protein F441_03428 [Phytophthora nicotianae CJ01A1]
MRISIVAVDPDNTAGPWRIVHTRDGSSAHNHPPSSDVRVHVAHRQRAARKTTATSVSTGDLVEVRTMAGVSTSRIYATMLIQEESTMLIPKDIAKAKAATRSKLLANRTSNEALFKMLDDKGFYYCYEIDPESNRLIYLMWAHSATTKLSRDFMDLLILDCTYKTNRFHSTVAQSSHYRSRPNATEIAFPECSKMLCFWHIRRNVVAQAQKKIGDGSTVAIVNGMQRKKKIALETDIFMAKFDETVDSTTEDEFEERRAGLHRLNSAMGKYLDAQWWPHRTKFVRCWTDQYSHFGCRDTSTVEGTHATMKSWLDNSQGDILKVFMRLLPWWSHAASRTSLKAANDESNIPTLFRKNDNYSAIAKIITIHAFRKTDELWAKARAIVVHNLDRSVCDGTFRRVHGRPCIHDLMAIIESDDPNVKLRPEQFDRHWWLPSARNCDTERVLEPATRRRGRRFNAQQRSHQTGYGAYSTRREPLGFEIIEQNLAVERMHAAHVPSFTELLQSEDTVQYEQKFLPPRSWGYAGLRSLDEDC